ncbi:inactive serine/threonine-protein kinase TEX14 isoform X3 [Pseudophryne corroboree]|uniref:inactive serine/threonine-protein kinase TEX14 isoform X3 n=1 Tax=Pseudophryne corroboree TaxID=495146 RepID=UPI00308149C7
MRPVLARRWLPDRPAQCMCDTTQNTMSCPNLPPYPVQIGSMKYDSNEKQLHKYVRGGNYLKVKKILKKDIDVDSTNSQGQTPLFVAALLGLQRIVDLLLTYGSNPNHRCFDYSTPVHAAAFSCNQMIMSKLIDAGGDLRLHDKNCRSPYDWALMAGKDQCAEMLKFIDRCSLHMQALIHCYPLKPMRIATSQELVFTPSLIDLLSPRNADKSIKRCHKRERISENKICNFGYGQVFLQGDSQAGFVLTVPFIEDKNIVQQDSKPTFSFPAGPYMIMENMLWECTEVTVKGLCVKACRNSSKEPLVDLLLAEQKNISKLQHPLILQLLALCVSPSLEGTRLVFERVTFGSFYNILHEKRTEFPILHMETITHLLLQMIDALIFLHWRGFIHCSFSSHAIQIVSAGRAKLSNFEYMIESKNDKEFRDINQFPIPKQLYCWASPEVILGNTVSVKSDLYSLCVVMQECLTDSLPWNDLDGHAIRDAVGSGHYLCVDPRLFKPYDSIVCTGIQAKPEERTMNLQDIRYLLKNEFKNNACTKNASGSVSIETECDGRDETFENETGLCCVNRTETLSSTKSQSDTQYVTTEQASSGSPSATLSLISDSETSTESNSQDEDTDCESTELNDDFQAELQTLEHRLTSIQMHNKSTLDNLTFIQKFLGEKKIILDCTEETKQSERVHVRERDERSNKCPPDKPRDEVDNMVPCFKGKSYAGWCAIGPPPRYLPPGIALRSWNDVTEADMLRDIGQSQSKCTVDSLRQNIRKNEWCGAQSSFKVKNPDKPSTNQIYTQFIGRSSKNSGKHDDGIETNRLHGRANSTTQWATNSRRDFPPTWTAISERQCMQNKEQWVHLKEREDQSQESSKIRSQEDKEDNLEKLFLQFAGRRSKSPNDKEHCEIPIGLKPYINHTKDIDVSTASSETNYFTPEYGFSAENSDQETLNVCEKSDKVIEGCSAMCSEDNEISSQENKSFMYWTGDRTFQRNMPEVTKLTLSSNTRSTIDVEELSSISCDYKTPSKNLTASISTEASARHSTPNNPDKIESGCKVIFSQENRLRCSDTSCWTSLDSSPSNENISTRTSEDFLSALATSDILDCNPVSILKKKTFSLPGHIVNTTSGKSQESGSTEDALLESYCLLNKTDCECRSMEITSLTNVTEADSKCDHSRRIKFGSKITVQNTDGNSWT